MKNLLITWLVMAVSIVLAAYLLPGVIVVDYMTALIVAAVLGIINTIIRPILVFLTMPITILTLGLFIFILNALLIMIADRFVDGFGVQGFWWALIFSLVLSFIYSVLSSFIDENKQM